ncbi:stage III sporulation protein AB [Clostridium sp. Cult3]|mgnify:CR=1 FL=1|uniref:stage III sporulation protein AB n=1 Tax=Clostridium sp. Cult3 TaxID=2079004 RepID=UPI001F47F223|nr:stage III sporulation protein AB [Clostridium sp. Cult3]MCF6460086.1 stage III sporulation protein AB [Clostridium sp. Cult3]
MVFLKFAGGTLVLLSSSLMGFSYGKKYSNRLNNLIYMEQCIKILETEIVYGAVPLPEALLNVYNKGNKKVSFIFKEIRDHILNNRVEDVYYSFFHVRHILKESLYFKQQEIEIFLSLGRILGASDREDQEKNFKLILNQIILLEKEAKLERDKNEKMFKNLGVLIGLAIVIILI